MFFSRLNHYFVLQTSKSVPASYDYNTENHSIRGKKHAKVGKKSSSLSQARESRDVAHQVFILDLPNELVSVCFVQFNDKSSSVICFIHLLAGELHG